MRKLITTCLLAVTLFVSLPKKEANAGLVIAGLAMQENYLMYLGAGLGAGVAFLGVIAAELTGDDTLGAIYLVMGGVIFLDEENVLQKDAVVDHLTQTLPESVDGETILEIADQVIANHAATKALHQDKEVIPSGLSVDQFNQTLGPLMLSQEDKREAAKVLL